MGLTRRRSLLAGLGLALTGFIGLSTPLGAAQNAPVDDDPVILPRYLLADPQGRALSSEDFKGKFQLIAFGYTYCPDVCPTTLMEMTAILNELGEAGQRLQAIFITVDPERDTGSVLKTYTQFFHPRILGLTGSPALVRRAADQFKVRYAKVREPGDPPERYSVDHSAGLYLLGPDGRYLRKFAYATPVDSVVSALRTFLGRG